MRNWEKSLQIDGWRSSYPSVDKCLKYYERKVKSEGTFKVTIIQDAIQSVEIIADNNVIQKINTRVVDNELRLYLDDGKYQGLSLEVNISVQRINGLRNSGTGNMSVYNVEEEGAFVVNNSGSADILIEGNVSSFNVKNEGSGNIMGSNFFATNCSVEIDGSGSVEVSCSDNLNVEIC